MKAYTTIEQSKKLAEILPLESADMYYYRQIDNDYFPPNVESICPIPLYKDGKEDFNYDIRCWSLDALLDALRVFTTPTAFSAKVSAPSLTKAENGYKLTYTGDYTPMANNGLDIEAPIESVADNPVDSCYELILKLNKLKML